MRRLRLLVLLALLIPSPASAEWLGIVRCQGTPPTCLNPVVVPMTATPPVVTPPVTPPPPPVVTPPKPRDPTPFIFPTNCPTVPWNGSGDRSYILGRVPLPDFDGFYAIADGAGNPAGTSHTCACIIKPGASLKGEGGQPDKNVGDLRLWVPKAAAQPYGDEIRCACATGRLTCP